MSSEQEEIQKTLADLQKRAEGFQSGSSSESSSGSGFSSNPKLKLILTIVGVVVVLAASFYFAMRSGSPKKPIQPPPEVLEQIKQQQMQLNK